MHLLKCLNDIQKYEFPRDKLIVYIYFHKQSTGYKKPEYLPLQGIMLHFTRQHQIKISFYVKGNLFEV